MVSPLLPRLAAVFHMSVEMAGLMVPVYLVAYSVSTI